jgi:hypothetical protein
MYDFLTEHKEFLKAVAKRFGRAFVVGGIAGALGAMETHGGVFALAELETWAVVLFAGFVTGGLLGVDKLLRYDPEKE